MINIKKYKTLVFDCDGVVLDSNKVKTEAFYQAALSYGKAAADALVSYHVRHGGVSRYKKFEYFLEHIVAGQEGLGLDELLHSYATSVEQGLLQCSVAPGLQLLREAMQDSRWLIVSGGDQNELRDIFLRRKISDLFDGGIFGSPDTKEVILEREIARDNILLPALFLGDSKYDHVAASSVGLDFLFVSAWSEFKEWHSYCQEHGLAVAASLQAAFDGDVH